MRSAPEMWFLALCAIAGFIFAVWGMIYLKPQGRRRRENVEDLLEEWDSQDQLEDVDEDG